MSTLTVFLINGRKYYPAHLSNLRKGEYSYEWLVDRNGRTYLVWGGKKSGGASNQWYIEGGNFSGPVKCTSLTDAIRTLDTM